MLTIRGNIVDIENRKIFFGAVAVENGKISSIERLEGVGQQYILPGFVDAHIHIESSMLVPSDFARLAVVHGTVATVSDPHEIANVLGIEGVHYMIKNGKQVPFKFNFGAPSCVPATTFETAGATIDAEGVAELLRSDDIKYMAEMMNYPGVLFNDEEVLAKLEYAKLTGKPVDGHAPGLRGDDALHYIHKGISTDHECFSYEEALEKIQYGMKILIREGSAAKNFEALIGLLPHFPDMIMLCSDDKHPDDLIDGHINQLVGRALAKGYDLFDVLKVACFNPIDHYKLDVGRLRVGDPADFIITEELEQFNVKATYINGQKVAENGISLIERVEAPVVNNFNTSPKSTADFELKALGDKIRVIKAIDGELVTESFYAPTKIEKGLAIADPEKDILKMAVINRYENAPVAIAFIQGFNIKEGALASCVGHDSHNIIAVGTDDRSLCEAVNLIIENKGGISVVKGNKKKVLPLPVAGIMTNEDGYLVGQKYSELDAMTKLEMNCTLHAPFMTLSFMALLVIPELKLSDKGLFDGQVFSFASLFV